MAKDYKKGSDYRLGLMTSGTFASPTWTEIKSVGDIDVDPNPVDVEVPERGIDTGHLQGEKDPSFTFTLFEDADNSNVTTLIDAIYSGASVTLAVANGGLATTGTKGVKMDCVLFAAHKGARGDVSQWEVTARRHANSDNALTRFTV